MHYSPLTLATLLSVAHAGQTIKVVVGEDSSNKPGLVYTSDSIIARAGDIISFTYQSGNHNVVQSDFDHPCVDIAKSTGTENRIKSPYFPVPANATDGFPTFNVTINSTDPIWIFCGQGKHCEAGMAMVINPPANSDKTLDAYKAAAAMIGSGSGSNGSGNSTGGSNSTASEPSGNNPYGNSSGDSGEDCTGSGDDGSGGAGSPDAGSPDAGSPDAGSPNAGSPDAGSPAAGSPAAGSPDAGSPDAGSGNAGSGSSGSGVSTGASNSTTSEPSGNSPPSGNSSGGSGEDCTGSDNDSGDTGSPNAGSPDAGSGDNGSSGGAASESPFGNNTSVAAPAPTFDGSVDNSSGDSAAGGAGNDTNLVLSTTPVGPSASPTAAVVTGGASSLTALSGSLLVVALSAFALL